MKRLTAGMYDKELLEELKLCYQDTAQAECEADFAWAEGFNDGLDCAIHKIVCEDNNPLTLEKLREMDGEPVWICDPDGSDGMWALVDLEYELCRTAKGGLAIFETYEKNWVAYRRKPEVTDDA